MKRWTQMPVLLFLLASSSAHSSCLSPDMPKGSSKRSIQLLNTIPEPAFYYRAMDPEYTILVSQTALTTALRPGSELLDLIRKNPPSAPRTDLLTYIFLDSYVVSEIERTVGTLLEHGSAALFQAGTGSLLPAITVEYLNANRGASRTFREGKSIVFFQSDCIVD